MKLKKLALYILLLLHAGNLTGQAGQSSDLPLLKLYVAPPSPVLHIPGDFLRIAIEPKHLKEIPTDTFTLRFSLPEGVLLADAFWVPVGDFAVRDIAQPKNETPFPVDIRLRIDPKFRGHKLQFEASFTGLLGGVSTLTLSVGEVLSNTMDTCLAILDTNTYAIHEYLGVHRKIKARLKSPINLSPTSPLRVSHKNCSAFILNPKKKKKKKNKCTCLHYQFNRNIRSDFPQRYVPGPEKIQDTITFQSSGARGDTIEITVRSIDDKPLRGIMLTDAAGEIIDVGMNASSLSYSTVMDSTALQLTWHLRARRFLGIFPRKQYALVNAVRKPKAEEMLRGIPNAPTQPLGDTLVLSVDTLATQFDQIRRKKVTVRHHLGATYFYRVIESVDTNGILLLPRDTISVDTCPDFYWIYKNTTQEAGYEWVTSDTILFQAADTETQLVGARNPMGLRLANLEVNIPLHLTTGVKDTRDSLVGFAYWLGIGEQPIRQYEALLEEVPAEWSQPGNSPPLAAYLFEHPIVLPSLISGETVFQQKNVRYDFISAKSIGAFNRGLQPIPVINRNPNRPNFGTVSGKHLKQLYTTSRFDKTLNKQVLRFYLSAANQHQVNTYRLQLKIVAFYLVESREKSWGNPASEPIRRP